MVKIKSQTTFKFLVLIQIIFVAALFAEFSVRAWVEPATSPPGGNIAAPLNTGSDNQQKSGGGLWIYGNTFGVDGRGTTYGVLGYENDTGVYGYLGVSGWAGYFSGPAYVSGSLYAGSVCLSGVCYSSWPSSAETLQTVTNRGWTTSNPLYTSSYMQAPIFYDANNSGYYVDPASTSNVNAQYANSISTGYLDFRYAGGNSGQGNNAYAIFQEGGSWSYPYPDLRIAYHTGIKLGAHASYNGIRFYNDYNMSGLVMSVNDSSTGGANNVYIPNIAYVTDLRPQYMYDWNNTYYYMDFNNTSRLNQVYMVDARPQYMYDWNDSRYYMDFNGTSRLNYGVFDNIYSHSWMAAPIVYDNQNWSYYSDPNGTSVFNVVYANQFNCLSLSDLELKKDIKPLDNALEKTLSLRGVQFNWKDPAMGSGNQVGLIAQDVEKVLPEAVSANKDGYLGIDYLKLSPLLIEAVKDLKAEKDREINDLRQRIEILETDKKEKDEVINDLKKRIETLESK